MHWRVLPPKGTSHATQLLPAAFASIFQPVPRVQGRAAVMANEGVAESAFLKLPMVLAMAARGPQCFDVDYYMRRNSVWALGPLEP